MNDHLDNLFQLYRTACPDPEPSGEFMPRLWAKIERRDSFWFSFEHIGRSFAAMAAALCVLLLLLNLGVSGQRSASFATYPDALAADQSAENTYYSEAIRTSASTSQAAGTEAPVLESR